MNQPKLSVIYPKGFLDKPLKCGRPDSKEFCEKWEKFKVVQPLNIIEESIPTTLEELILNFNKIINTYKSNPEHYLSLNNISKILTNEESVIKHALSKLDGTKGRCVISKTVTSVYRSYEYVSYNPILKETKKQLLILFNRFKKTNDTNESDIILYEGNKLFIHLFAIVIDSLHVPDEKKKDCTDIFPMITLLELLLNKKYKTILESRINNIPLPISISTLENNDADNNSGDDDEWDKDDFELLITTLIPTITNHEPETEAEAEAEAEAEPEAEAELILENNKKNDEKQIEEIPDDWDN
jgi:hypothetical protein